MTGNLASRTPLRLASGLAWVALLGACEPAAEACVAGSEGCPCSADACVGDLVCEAGMCIDPSGRGDTDHDDDESGGDSGHAPSDDDGESGDDTEPLQCGETRPTVEGTISSSVGDDLAFDRVNVGIRHKRDIDPAEDGCINFVQFAFSKGDGCRLEITAGEHLDDGALRIISTTLGADSQCPGFDDDVEGIYSGGESHSYVVLSQWSIDEQNVAETCFAGSATLYLDAELQRGPNTVTLDGTLTVTGDFESAAEELACP